MFFLLKCRKKWKVFLTKKKKSKKKEKLSRVWKRRIIHKEEALPSSWACAENTSSSATRWTKAPREKLTFILLTPAAPQLLEEAEKGDGRRRVMYEAGESRRSGGQEETEQQEEQRKSKSSGRTRFPGGNKTNKREHFSCSQNSRLWCWSLIFTADIPAPTLGERRKRGLTPLLLNQGRKENQQREIIPKGMSQESHGETEQYSIGITCWCEQTEPSSSSSSSATGGGEGTGKEEQRRSSLTWRRRTERETEDGENPAASGVCSWGSSGSTGCLRVGRRSRHSAS